MKELLGYDTAQVLFYGLMIFLAIKEVWSLVDFFVDKFKKNKDDAISEIEKNRQLNEKIDNLTNSVAELNSAFIEYKEFMKAKQEENEKNIATLVDSDKDSIKSFIVEKYHEYYDEKGWIDDYTLDTIEKRYEHYKEEGGNSYVTGLVNKIRTLPLKTGN